MSLKDKLKEDARATWKRQSPISSVPTSVGDTVQYLSKGLDNYLKDDDDRTMLEKCVKDAQKLYGVDKKDGKIKGIVSKLSQAGNRLGYVAQAAGDVMYLTTPWGIPYKMAAGLARFATDMMYAPYYLWNTGVEGLKDIPEYAAQKVLGTLLPGGTLIDKMSLKDRQNWMAVERAKVDFLKRKGAFVPMHERLANAVYKGAEYLKGWFGGNKKPDYDPEPLPMPAPA